jgi:hypothetical protein
VDIVYAAVINADLSMKGKFNWLVNIDNIDLKILNCGDQVGLEISTLATTYCF